VGPSASGGPRNGPQRGAPRGVEQPRFGWRDRGRAMMDKVGLYGQNGTCRRGSGLKVVRKPTSVRGKPDANGAGMSLKINEMRKCHPHQGFWRRGVGRRFRLKGRRRSEPKRLNPRCSNQIQGFRPERTQASYLPWNLSVTAEIGPFFSKFECESSVRSRIRSLESLMLPPMPRLNRLDGKVAGGGLVRGVSG